jgi:hypothetical protein
MLQPVQQRDTRVKAIAIGVRGVMRGVGAVPVFTSGLLGG